MIAIDIRIGDWKEKDKPLFGELSHKPFKEIEIVGCAILERGTTGGNPSFFLHGFDGEITVGFQLTENMFHALHAALQGAKQRWAEQK